jgi:hypothetical protein
MIGIDLNPATGLMWGVYQIRKREVSHQVDPEGG